MHERIRAHGLIDKVCAEPPIGLGQVQGVLFCYMSGTAMLPTPEIVGLQGPAQLRSHLRGQHLRTSHGWPGHVPAGGDQSHSGLAPAG
eukprot:scaffold645_cov417-Prasinococcus_capsulatus_cf.AAC.2